MVTPGNPKPFTAHNGTIFFLAEGRPLADATSAQIDENGRYECSAQIDENGRYECIAGRRSDRIGGRWYRIFVALPSMVEPPPVSAAPEVAESRERLGGTHVRSSADAFLPPIHVIQASLKAPDPEPRGRPAAPRPAHRFTSPATTNLFVRLDGRAACVNVALSD
jgi:hypothetical protein